MEMTEMIMSMSFATDLSELCEDLEDLGLEVLESNREYITAGYDDDGDDVELRIGLGGTEHTIVITGVEEVYRG